MGQGRLLFKEMAFILRNEEWVGVSQAKFTVNTEGTAYAKTLIFQEKLLVSDFSGAKSL